MPQYDFTRPIDLNSLPASVILANAQDPARQIEGAPPIFGQDIVPHFYTSTGYVGSAARAYPVDDEATRNSVENAERMRTESAIMECLEARMRATALLKWHVVPENEKSPKEIKLAQLLTKLLERIPYFTRYRYSLMEALWFGKAAIVNTFGTEQVGDQYRTVVSDWSPRHGDKLMFRYADGTYKYKAGQLGIRVHSAFFANMPPKLQNLPYDQLRMKVEATQYGLVYWFDDYERDTIVVHKHIVEDGPWHEPRMMGRVMGVGIRDRIYWTWYAMNALLADLMTFVSRAALGVRIWRYPSGNKNWKDAVESAAKNAIANGVADILFPVEPNEYAGMYGVEQIEPGITGATMIRELIENFFLKKIKKYILGQLLTTEAESTGQGSGVAAAHIQTFSDIVRFDAVNESESLTRELLRKLQYENARDSMGCYPRLVLDCDEPDVQKRLAAISSAYQMDIPIRVEDVYMMTGLAIPEPGDEVVTVSTQQLRQQKALMSMQGEEALKQQRAQMQLQAEMAQQQAVMQQQMGGAPGGSPQPGQEQGQPQEAPSPDQEPQPQDKAALDQTLDVSPQGTDRDNGPVMSGELAKNATGEATYEIQRQATNPWDGFWESFFNAARGGPSEVQNDPLPEVPDAPVDESPAAEVQPDPLPTPKVQTDPMVTTLSEIMDQYVQKERTIQEWTQDLDRALRRQSMARGLDPTGNRQNLVRQLGDALDHEMLVAQLTDMLDVRSSSYAADEAVDLGAEPERYPESDQYAALSFNPIMHPRGGAGNAGQFTKKIGVDPDAVSSPEPGGPGMESGEPQAMVAPPLPPARSAVARVDLPDEINNKVQELAAHIPDYLLDGEGRTEDAHITLKILSDDDPRQIASLLQDEAPFRAVLGQVTVVDATEARPFDVVAIKVHSPAINRLHKKLSRALDDVGTRNGFVPHLRVADVQPGTADKWIGWDGLEGESVIVDSLTFVNRNHEAHKIPLQGAEGEYVLEEPYTSDQEGIEQPIDKQADQYVASGYRSRAVKDDPRQMRMLVPPPEPIGSTKVATFRDWGHAEEQEHPRQSGGLWGKKFVDTSAEHPLPMFDTLKHQHAAELFRDEAGNPRLPDPTAITSVLGKSPVNMITARQLLSHLGLEQDAADDVIKGIFWNPQHEGYDQTVMPQQLAESIHQRHQQWHGTQETPGEQTSYCAETGSSELGETELPQDPVDIEPERYTMTAAEIAQAVKSWKEPSKAQIEAENYTKPTIAWKGLTIKIETPKGKKRNPAWPDMPAHYGYFSRVGDQASEDARDGDKPDVFIAGNPESDLVVVIDQETPGGRFDEWKVVIGCNSEKEAIDLYRSAYTSGWRVGPATSMTIKQFKTWLDEMPDKGRIAEQVSKYAAKYGFSDIHPRHEQNKRFVEKHASLTLAQTIDRPPTPGEHKTYDDYVDFLKVGKNKPLSFKDWLKFHRTTKFYQAQKEREDAAKAATGGRDSEGPGEDPEASPKPDQDMEGRRGEGSRDPGEMGSGGETEQLIGGEADKGLERAATSVSNINAVREFAANLYAAYYES